MAYDDIVPLSWNSFIAHSRVILVLWQLCSFIVRIRFVENGFLDSFVALSIEKHINAKLGNEFIICAKKKFDRR